MSFAGTLDDVSTDVRDRDWERVAFQALKIALLVAPRLARLPAWPVLLGEILVDVALEGSKLSADEKVLAGALRDSEFGRNGCERVRKAIDFRRRDWIEPYYDWEDPSGRTTVDLTRVREILGAQSWSLRLIRTSSAFGRESVDGVVVGFSARPEIGGVAHANLEQDRIPGYRRPIHIETEIVRPTPDGGVVLSLTVTSSMDPLP